MAWVAERKDVLSGLFFMLTLGAYSGYVAASLLVARYLAVAVLFALGLMAKPMLVTLPFVLLLLDYWPLARFQTPAGTPANSRRVNRRRVALGLVAEKIPLLALVVASCGRRCWPRRGDQVGGPDPLPSPHRTPWFRTWPMSGVFCPAGLAPYYPFPADDATLKLGRRWGALAVLAAITVAVVARGGGAPPVGRLVLVPGHVGAGDRVGPGRRASHGRPLHLPADRPLPSRPPGVPATWSFSVGSASLDLRDGAGAIVLAALTACACRQASYWRDSVNLWTHAVRCTTPNATAYYNLADAESELSKGLKGQAKQEIIDAAIEHYKKNR